jgi:hypothetical protein
MTVKRVERGAEGSGAALAAASRSRARLIAGRKLVPPQPLPGKLYAVIDGTGVSVTGKEAEGRDGKGEDGRARTREAKPAVYFAQDKVNDEGPAPLQSPPASHISRSPRYFT